MAIHNDIGKKGEELADSFLKRNGYTVLYRNWRFMKFEIDIIAIKDGKPHFVEVKCRTSDSYGLPEESVTPKKSRHIFKAVNEFMYQHPEYTNLQIDILTIILHNNTPPIFFMIEDVV